MALRTSMGVAKLLRSRRKELRLTLREVCERISSKGEQMPPSTLARIEQGKLDPGIRRLHLLLDLYQIPPHLVADLIEMEALAAEPPVESDLQALFERGLEFWKQGNIQQGLAYLFALRERVPEDQESRLVRQRACHAFANAALNVGKVRLARQIVDDLLCEPPDPAILVRVLVLASLLWRGLGSTDAALAFIEQAERHIGKGDDQDDAWVLHQKAKILVECGAIGEAEAYLKRALAAYRRIDDPYGESRALALQVTILEAKGEMSQAVECAVRIIEAAVRQNHTRIEAVMRLELGGLLVASGNPEQGLAELNRGLGISAIHGDQPAQFVAHYKLWKTYEKLGDPQRAKFEREAAMYFVRFTDEHSAESDEVRELARSGRSAREGGRS
jgi:tetratricopeptide (TPR) repeat protein